MAENTALRQVQEAETALLEIFAEICEKHHLRYYLAYGTLIGAIRHQGFIPWDDDIDVMMPRPDYERFLEVTGSGLPEGVRVDHYSRQGYRFYGSNIRFVNDRMQFAVPRGREVEWQSVWIDVIPMDGLPAEKAAETLPQKYAFSPRGSDCQRRSAGRPFQRQAGKDRAFSEYPAETRQASFDKRRAEEDRQDQKEV